MAAVDGVAEESSVAAERQIESRLPLLAFLIGVLESVRRGFDRLSMSEWLSWWPFRQEKRLERLIAEADANPKDAAKQSALLVKLNKHRSWSFCLVSTFNTSIFNSVKFSR